MYIISFNGGSEVAADGKAGMAALVTQIATAMAALTWMFTDWYANGKPSVLGMVNGAISGLVAITPASGYVDPTGGFFIGALAGPVCYYGAILKHQLGYDDALDAFGVHAIGGMFGALATAFFASKAVCPNCKTNGILYETGSGYYERAELLGLQIYGVIVTVGWSFVVTLLICKFVDATMGLRISEAEEDAGMDSSMHGESIDGSAHSVDESDLIAKLYKSADTNDASQKEVEVADETFKC